MSLKEKLLAILVCMFVLNSCTWSDVPVQECYPPDTTGVDSSVVVWDYGVEDDVSETSTLQIDDGGLEWGVPLETYVETIADTDWTTASVGLIDPPYRK